MASVSMSEKDYQAVCKAALSSESAGDIKAATELDRIARKISAALTRGESLGERRIARAVSGKSLRMGWKDVPTILRDQSSRKAED